MGLPTVRDLFEVVRASINTANLPQEFERVLGAFAFAAESRSSAYSQRHQAEVAVSRARQDLADMLRAKEGKVTEAEIDRRATSHPAYIAALGSLHAAKELEDQSSLVCDAVRLRHAALAALAYSNSQEAKLARTA